MNDPELPHLTIQAFVLSPKSKWLPPAPGWWMISIQSGAGNVLSSGLAHQLDPGAAFRISPVWSDPIRASQISPLEFRAFRVDLLRLSGLLSVTEERFFKSAEKEGRFAFQFFPAAHPLARSARNSPQSTQNDLSARLSAFQLFVETFERPLQPDLSIVTSHRSSAAQRLEKLLREIPATDLIQTSVHDLVNRLHCTPRHFSRLFHELVGVSFREKQTQVRLDRAVQLLGSTDLKIIDVALESGFPSVSLFNILFKRRFHVPPRQWRHNSKNANSLISPPLAA